MLLAEIVIYCKTRSSCRTIIFRYYSHNEGFTLIRFYLHYVYFTSQNPVYQRDAALRVKHEI